MTASFSAPITNPTIDAGQSTTQVLASFSVSVGDIVVVAAGAWNGSAVASPTIADSLANTWQVDASALATTTAARIFSSKITNAGSMVVTITGSNTYNWEVDAFKLLGADTTTWLDVGAGANIGAGGNSISVTTGTASAGNRIVLMLAGTRGNFGTLTWTARTIGGSAATAINETDAATNSFGTSCDQRSYAPGAATVNGTWTLGQNIGADAVGVIAVYKEAAAVAANSQRLALMGVG